jgi:Predicted solute binding protein
MKISIKVIISVLVACLVLTACGLVGNSGGNSNAQTSPNLTLTALFDTSNNIPATVTPIYVVVTNTPEPTLVPSNTPVPTATTVPTAVPTATTAPTATAVANVPPPQPAPMQRSGTLMQMGYVGIAPVIDGSWSDWDNYTTQYPVASIVYGRNHWTGADDLQASYAAGWDYNYLYIGVKVHDDVYAQNATGADIYKGDSIEILLDKDLYGDYYTQYLSGDDYQLGISGGNPATGKAPSAYLWFPSSYAGTLSNVDVAMTQETGVYRIEARIPWSVFGINPHPGMHLGFAVSVSDNDDTTQNVQQTMASSAPYRSLVDPTSWGEIALTK